jgi:hypothetical protein
VRVFIETWQEGTGALTKFTEKRQESAGASKEFIWGRPESTVVLIQSKELPQDSTGAL